MQSPHPSSVSVPAPAFEVLKTLKEVFGYDRLRPGQDRAVAALLAGHDVFAVMPTGAGKSLCFQLPALIRGGLTLVVSPLIALMSDQVSGLKLLGVAAGALHSGQSRETNVAVWRRAAAGDLRLLYISPERLMTPRMIPALQKLQPRCFAIDEAHCISQWGAAFRPEYARLEALKNLFPQTPLIGLTATADPKTRSDIKQKLFAQPPVEVETGFDRPNLRLVVQQRAGGLRQIEDFLAARPGQSGIIYCLSRKKTEELAAQFNRPGRAVLPYHAGLDRQHLDQVLDRFMSEPGVIITATIAFGMGIDKPDIRFVVHADLPGNMEAYYQEIGRAGRDGQPADCLLLWGANDLNQRRRFIADGGGDETYQRLSVQRLNALMTYVDAVSCRRAVLLRYFGDPGADRIGATGQTGAGHTETGRNKGCGNCDLCLSPVETRDESEAAVQIANAILQTGSRFGIAHICDVVRGADTEKTRKFGHVDLSAFGSGKHQSLAYWRTVTRQMQSAGLLETDLSHYGRARVTPRLTALMNGEGSFQYHPPHSPHPAKSAPKSATKSAGAPKNTGDKKTIPAETALSQSEDALLSRLKALRRELASERKVPAYIIFSDRSLIDMALKAPATKEAFCLVNGVGAAKLEAFGDLFLKTISESA